MSKNTSPAGLRLSESAESSTLYRLGSYGPQARFSEAQAIADHIVTGSISEATKGSMLLAAVGAGWSSRLLRAGALSYAPLVEGRTVLPTLLRGGSYAVSLAGESAAFAGIERSVLSLQGHTHAHSFQMDWARAGVNLGPIKFLGGAAGAQNPVMNHMLTDLGMVGGQHLGAAWGLMEKPEGTFAEQMAHAEAVNWTIKGGTHLVHSFTPNLSASERSLDIYLQSRDRGLSSLKNGSFPFLSPPVAVSEGGPNLFSARPKKVGKLKLPNILMMTNGKDKERGKSIDEEPDEDKTLPRGVSPVLPAQAAPAPAAAAPALPAPPIMAGQIVDHRYRVESMLGFGGMGVVFRCTHVDLNMPVAMKVLKADHTKNADVIARFKLEAQTVTSLKNPHIIKITDFGKLPDGSNYFIMEFLNGQSLAQVIDAEKMVAIPRIIPIARQMAKGLSAAHKAGIIHRDIKAENIFLTQEEGEQDFVKILDFGLAKRANPSGPRLTADGAIFGTPHYMSPQQAMGQPVDHRADIYAFGVLLYEMASGQLPFNHPSDPSRILTDHITKEPPPLSSLNPKLQEVPPELEAIIMKCLSKSPEDRYQSMDDLIADLDTLKSGGTTLAMAEMTTREKRGRWPIYAGIGGGVALAGAATAAFFVLGPSGGAPAPSATTPVPSDALPLPIAPSASVSAPVPPITTQEVTVTVEPKDAQVFLKGFKLGIGTVTVGVKSGATVEIEIRREGYITKIVTLDGSQEKLSVQLDPSKSAKPRPSGSATSQPKPKPSGWKDEVDDPWRRK